MGNSFFLLKEWLPNPIRPSAVLGAAVAAAVATQRQCHPRVCPPNTMHRCTTVLLEGFTGAVVATWHKSLKLDIPSSEISPAASYFSPLKMLIGERFSGGFLGG